MTSRRGAGAALGALGVVLVLGLGELASRAAVVAPEDVPPPSDVLSEFVGQVGRGTFWSDVVHTLTGWAVGLAVAVFLGVLVGALLGSSATLWRALRPTVEFLRPVPSVALIPLAILVWGQSLSSTVFLVAFGAVWPMVVQTMYGVSQIDEVARDTARSFALSRVDVARYVILPSALPFVATGLRIASATALIVGVTAEVIIGTPGLGATIALSQASGAVVKMYALIFTTGVLGVAIHVVFTRLEHHFLRWHVSQQGPAI